MSTTAAATTATLSATVERARFERALTLAGLTISRRPAVPIVASVHLWADGSNRLMIDSFNYEQGTRESMPVLDAEGDAVVQHEPLLKVVKALRADAMIMLAMDGDRLTLTDGDKTFRVPVNQYAADFPALPTLPSQSLYSTTGKVLLEQVARLAKAASADVTLSVLTNVQFKVGAAGTVLMHATDRYRLAQQDTGAHYYASQPLTVAPLVPAKALLAAAKAFKDAPSVHVRAALADGTTQVRYVAITDPFRTVFWRDGSQDMDYPAVERLIPTEENASIDLPIKPMLDAIKTAAVALERNEPVAIRFETDHVRVTGGSDTGLYAETPIKARLDERYTRPDAMGFNPIFLTDGLAMLGGDTAHMSIVIQHKPAVFTSEATPGFKYVLVPVRFAG